VPSSACILPLLRLAEKLAAILQGIAARRSGLVSADFRRLSGEHPARAGCGKEEPRGVRDRSSDMLTENAKQQAPEPVGPKPVPYPPPKPHPPDSHPKAASLHSELSAAAILGVSALVGILGPIIYYLAVPLTPAQRIALGHAAISEVVTR
jgi:hypothetical protein